MTRSTLLRSAALALSGVVASLSLGACNKAGVPTQTASTPAQTDTNAMSATGPTEVPGGALAPTETAPPTAFAQAPAAVALAPAPPAPLAAPAPPAQQYQYVDRAASMGAAFADAPPDYTVDYQGTRPWIWRARNGAYRIVELTPAGERSYFFMPGAGTPFLVRDSTYTYAYDQGRLVVVYGPRGLPQSSAIAAQQAAMAGRYLIRARALFNAAAHDKHVAAYAANWRVHRAAIVDQQQQWRQEQQQNAAWRAWRDQHVSADQAALDRERAQRQAYAAQLEAAKSSQAQARRNVDLTRAANQARSAKAQQTAAQAQAARTTRQTQNADRRAVAHSDAAARARAVGQVRASQVEVDAARQNLAKAKAPTADPSTRARMMDAARARLRLALQAQAKANAAAR